MIVMIHQDKIPHWSWQSWWSAFHSKRIGSVLSRGENLIRRDLPKTKKHQVCFILDRSLVHLLTRCFLLKSLCLLTDFCFFCRYVRYIHEHSNSKFSPLFLCTHCTPVVHLFIHSNLFSSRLDQSLKNGRAKIRFGRKNLFAFYFLWN